MCEQEHIAICVRIFKKKGGDTGSYRVPPPRSEISNTHQKKRMEKRKKERMK